MDVVKKSESPSALAHASCDRKITRVHSGQASGSLRLAREIRSAESCGGFLTEYLALIHRRVIFSTVSFVEEVYQVRWMNLSNNKGNGRSDIMTIASLKDRCAGNLSAVGKARLFRPEKNEHMFSISTVVCLTCPRSDHWSRVSMHKSSWSSSYKQSLGEGRSQETLLSRQHFQLAIKRKVVHIRGTK